MKVKDLIAQLQTYDPEMLVISSLHSEYILLSDLSVDLGKAQPPRPDGWVHRARPDKPTQDYIIIE